MVSFTEEEIRLAKSGHTQTIEKIVRKTASPLYNVAYQIVKNNEDAEDVLQDTFLRMVRHLPTFREESSLTTWLYRITTNVALEKIRKNKTVKEMRDIDDEEFMEIDITSASALDEFHPEKQLLNEEFKQLVTTYLQDLPEKTRLVFVLRDQEGLDLAEIIEITGDTEWSVKGRLKRARGYLREKLASYMDMKGEPHVNQ